MTWTTNKPTVPGWYWWRFSKDRKATVLNISQSHIQKSEVFTMETHNIGTVALFIDELPGEWSSQAIAPPREGEAR
jgi:hypothetical protein